MSGDASPAPARDPAPSAGAPRAPGVRRPRWLAFFLLPALLALAGYGYTLGDFFLADDFTMLRNAALAGGWRDAVTLGEAWDERWFRPLGVASWWVSYHAFGLEPFGYRAVNLLVHVANAGLLAWLVASLSGHDGAGAVAGAAFAVLPNHAEAVTWTSARFDPLSALGVLVCLLAWTRYATVPRAWSLVVAALGLAWAVLAKEPGFLVLGMIPVVTLGYLGRPTRRAWLGYAALAGVGAGLFLLRWSVVGGVGGISTGDEGSLLLRLDPRRAVGYTLEAVRSCLAPVSALRFPGPWHPLVAVPAAAGLVAVAACVRAGCAGRALRLAWPLALLFLLALLPMVTWAHVGPDNQSTRYLYVPTLFSCAAIGVAFVHVGSAPGPRVLAWSSAAVLVGAWTVGLGLENRSWHAASASAREILAAFPPPDAIPGRRIVVVGLPDNHQGAFLYRNSFGFAVRLFTDERRKVTQLTEAAWEERAGPPARGTAVLRWDADGRRWERAR